MAFGEKLRNAMEKLRQASVFDKETIREAVKDIQRELISADVENALVQKLSKEIEKQAFAELPKGVNRREQVIKATYDLLVEILGGKTRLPEKPKKILLVGLQGGGKTTTIAKLAKYYSKRGLKVGVIAADTFRPAAFEQLKQLSEKAGIAFYGNKKEKNAAKVIQEGLNELKGIDLIIADSAGRSGLDKELTKEIKEIAAVFKPDQSWLVLGADTGQIAKKQAKAFHDSTGVNGVIITRMDGSAKGGGALAACHETNAPVYFIGTGEKIEDLEEFDADRYLSRVMGYGDLQGLLEKVKEIEVEEFDPEALMKGEFNLEAFYQQLKAARQMGPLNKVMEMVGLSQQIPKDMIEVGEEKLNGFKVIMDSMTKQEKKDPEVLNRERIERIAKGSGKKEEEVRELIKQFKTMKKMFKQFKGLNEKKLQKKGLGGLLKGFKGIGKKKKFKIR